MALPGFGAWHEDPLWAAFYDWTVEHGTLGGALWRIGIGSDLGLLYEAAEEIGRQPAGARILDMPCGGGVALRGLKPGQGVSYVAADIAREMLERTMEAASEREVDDQVEIRVADVATLPFADRDFDLVVSFTGLHCFPDPRRAVAEMARVLRPDGVVTGSMLASDTGARYEPLRRAGRRARLLGPMCSRTDVVRWFAADGVPDLAITTSGAVAYFRGVRR